MPLPFSITWRKELPTWASLPLMPQGDSLIVRVGNTLRAIDAGSGEERWSLVVDPGGGSGHLVHVSADLCVTDRRPDPLHLTQLVVVRDGALLHTIDLDCIVIENASVVAAGLLYVIGNDPRIGPVFRAVDIESGTRRVDVPLSQGADSLLLQGGRFLILNRMGSPGLYWVSPEGKEMGVVEQTPAQEARISGTRSLAALRSAEFPARTVQARDLSGNTVLWTAPAHGAVIGIDGDDAAYFEPGTAGIPVLCDAATGQVRWRAASIPDPAQVFIAEQCVFIGHMTGLRAHHRSDGRLLGDIPDGSLAQSFKNRLYLGGFKFLMCVALGSER